MALATSGTSPTARGLRIVIELRRESQAEIVLNNLYKHTALQSAFSVNTLALVEGQPQVLPLKRILRHYIDFRRQVITRRAEFDLKKAQDRAHILEGLRIALNNLDAVINLIRQSADAETARQGLMTQFDLTQVQAQAILDMQLRRIAALERERIEEEYQGLVKTIAELEALLADPKKILAEIKKETRKLRKDYGDDRRTEITGEEARSYTPEEQIQHQEMVITITQRGYIKCMPASTYRAQHRGGRGITGMSPQGGGRPAAPPCSGHPRYAAVLHKPREGLLPEVLRDSAGRLPDDPGHSRSQPAIAVGGGADKRGGGEDRH